MPIQLRKLQETETATLFTTTKKIDLTEYVAALRDLQPGDSVELPIPTDSTRRREVRSFNKAAAEVGGIKLKWKFQDDLQYMQVITATDSNGKRRRKNGTAAGVEE